MNRVFLAFFTAFVLTARADGTLKCYQCFTSTNTSCEDPSKNANFPLSECKTSEWIHWHEEMQKDPLLKNIARIFDIDQPHSMPQVPNAACAKMTLNVGQKKVIVRSCQTAKMPILDPCQAIRRKLSTSSFDHVPGRVVSMDDCNLCQSDGCNGANGLAPPKILALLFGSLGLMLFQAFRHRFA